MTKAFTRTLMAGAAAVATMTGASAAIAQSDGGSQRRVQIDPYLELEQVLVADLGEGSDVLTYTTVAVGADASVATRRAEAQLSLRYERRFFYDDQFGDEDYVSGIARGNVHIIPNTLMFEAGGIATRSSVDARGGLPANQVGALDNVTQVYSVYAGPAYSSQVGPVQVNASYQLGYTKVEEKDVVLGPGQDPVNIFDDSVTHSLGASVGMQPGPLPFGWSVSAGFEREDAGELDQRFEGKYGRADVTVPVTPTLAVVGGVGYEDIEISERDAVRDVNGDPVVDAQGKFVTDESSPRLLSYDEDGVYWDVGVLWRPSRRTSLEARVGRRYDSTTYIGNFAYQPTRDSSIGVSVYDTVSGFGSRITDQLAGLDTSFETTRNPLSGELTGCAFGSGNALCFNDLLQSAVSSSFRSRGVTGSYQVNQAGWNVGLAAGYQKRKYFASALGAQSNLDGLSDESYFTVLSLGRELDERSQFDANVYANYLDSGFANAPGVLNLGANAAYSRHIIAGLSGTAAVGLDHSDFDTESDTIASALVGLRYDF